MKRWWLLSLVFALGCGGGHGVRGDNDGDGRCDEDCPYLDVAPALGTVEALPLRGRVVVEDLPVDLLNADPYKELSQDEIDDARVTMTLRAGEATYDLGVVRADDEGWIDTTVALPAGVPAGAQVVEFRVRGRAAGSMRARLLPMDHAGVLVRSDIDMTYLSTDFRSVTGRFSTLTGDARERAALPGMPAVYRGLRAGAGGADDRPVVFLSGSPRFFKRTMEGRMLLDGVLHDGLVLKASRSILKRKILAFEWGDAIGEMQDQIGYKLSWLLRFRLDVPPGSAEVLMGDDTEADALVYALYHRLTAGELSPAVLDGQLAALDVPVVWRERIRRDAPRVVARLAGRPAPVRAIYINRTGDEGEGHPVSEWSVPGLTRYHDGAWPLVLDLYEEGLVSAAAVREVRAALDAAGVDAARRAATARWGGLIDEATLTRFEEDVR